MRKILSPDLYNFFNSIRHSLKKYHSLDGIDRKIEKYLNHNNGYFVELGANDGITHSNTLYFERRKNWKGLLIEPTPHNYLLCRRNRSHNTKVHCNACVSFNYKDKFVEIALSNLYSTPLGLESDIDDPMGHAKEGAKYLPINDVIVFGALAKPLNDLLLVANSPALIDLLSLDVEGAELEVLKGIDHSKFKFKFMCIECRNIKPLTEYLNDHGYMFVEQLSKHDYLFRCH